jgi:hypothetical protein
MLLSKKVKVSTALEATTVLPLGPAKETRNVSDFSLPILLRWCGVLDPDL